MRPAIPWTAGWFIGMAMGAAFAIVIARLQAADDAFKVYLAVCTAMLGAGLGFTFNRSMDAIADLRKQRRRMYLRMMEMINLRTALYSIENTIRFYERDGNSPKSCNTFQ